MPSIEVGFFHPATGQLSHVDDERKMRVLLEKRLSQQVAMDLSDRNTLEHFQDHGRILQAKGDCIRKPGNAGSFAICKATTWSWQKCMADCVGLASNTSTSNEHLETTKVQGKGCHDSDGR